MENPHGPRSLAGYRPWGHKELDMTEQLSTALHRVKERASQVAQLVKSLPATQETLVQFLGREIPLEKG